MTMGRIVIFLVISIGIAVAYGEERAPAAGPLIFHIPRQDLIEALQAYSEQSGVQVMYETAAAAGFKSTPVEGQLTPEAALRTLLADTDLQIRYSRPSAVTLSSAAASSPDEPPAHPLGPADLTLDTLRVTAAAEAVDRSRLGEYVGAVQSDIQKVLKRNRSGRADYRVAVRLWVTPSRTVERAELDGSTGDHDRDATIVDALRGLTLSQQAPPNTPRPIRFMISVHAL
ncbi:MAG: hypothetical protein JOY90_22160 [Bradyrhizobium sp.]|nr:hypothetical protein [Bradyrhizobium sp.]